MKSVQCFGVHESFCDPTTYFNSDNTTWWKLPETYMVFIWRWKSCLNAYAPAVNSITENRAHETPTSIAEGPKTPSKSMETHDALASRRHDVIARTRLWALPIRAGDLDVGGWYDATKQRSNTKTANWE